MAMRCGEQGCGYLAKNQSALSAHGRRHVREKRAGGGPVKTTSGEFRCLDCGMGFAKPNLLGIHRRFKHGVRAGNGKHRDPRPSGAPSELGRDTSEATQVAHLLREKARVHRERAEKLEEMAKEALSLL
jgi:hypothetical protein